MNTPMRHLRSAMHHRRAVFGVLAAAILSSNACLLLADVEALEDTITARVLVSGLRVGDRVSLVIDDGTTLAAPGQDDVLTFHLDLAPGPHTGRLKVARSETVTSTERNRSSTRGSVDESNERENREEFEDAEDGEDVDDSDDKDHDGSDTDAETGDEARVQVVERCATVWLNVTAGNVATTSVEFSGMAPCIAPSEPEECLPGLPCDDTVTCTSDDICLFPGVCVGVAHPDTPTCGGCAQGELCTQSCDEDCRCVDATCTQRGGPGTRAQAECRDHAVCRTMVNDAPSFTLDCLGESSCHVDTQRTPEAQLRSRASTLVVDVFDALSTSVTCTEDSACAVEARNAGQVQLGCDGGACALACDGTSSCAFSCSAGSTCALECEGGTDCALDCGDGAASCVLKCEDIAEPCAPGQRCTCAVDANADSGDGGDGADNDDELDPDDG